MRHDPAKSVRAGSGSDQGKASQAQRKPVRASRVSLDQSPPGASPTRVGVGPRHPGQSHCQTRVVRTCQGKPGVAKTIQGHDQGCQSQLDKPELGKARYDSTMARGMIEPGPDRPTELGQLRLRINQTSTTSQVVARPGRS